MDKLITYLAEYTDIDEGEIKGTSELVIDLGLTSYDEQIVQMKTVDDMYSEIMRQKTA